MLSELLLVLSGQPSSILVPTPAPPEEPTSLAATTTLTEYLHPGEVSSINTLGQLAFHYREVRQWALDTRQQGRKGILHTASTISRSRKGKQREVNVQDDEAQTVPDVYLSTLAAGVLDVLKEYEILVVTTETKVLSFNPGLVQDESTGYVPLSSLIAIFDPWQTPLASLSSLITSLSNKQRWTPAMLMEEVYAQTQTGHPKLQSIYESLLTRLFQQFLLHLQTFMLHGLAGVESDRTTLSLGLDMGADALSPSHRVYRLNEELLPGSVGRGTRESILYVGRVAATLKREGKGLPDEVLGGIREGIGNVRSLEEGGGLSQVVQQARAEVGE
jgi:gamma-tubulin complex component 4